MGAEGLGSAAVAVTRSATRTEHAVTVFTGPLPARIRSPHTASHPIATPRGDRWSERQSIAEQFRVKAKVTLRQATRAEIADADELTEGCFAANGDCAGLAAFYFRRG